MKNRFIKTVVAAGSLALMSFAATGAAQAAPAVHGVAPPAIKVFPTAGKHIALSGEGSGNLTYLGGPVQTHPRVYLVFWGKWWKSSCAGQQGHGAADESYLTSFFNARGLSSDMLSAVMTQYHGTAGQRSEFGSKVLYGTAFDCSNPPQAATQTQLGNVAVTYANYFKSKGQPINVNTQIVIVSPSGTNPGGGFGTEYCAWHSWAPDGSLELSYTNDPYMPDQGYNCSLSNDPHPLQGWSIVAGHEFAESVNDPQLNAWLDNAGYEIADKCAWEGLFTQSIGSKKFEEQPLWSDASSACALSDHVFVANPGNKSIHVNHVAILQIHAQASTVYCPTGFGQFCSSPNTVHRPVSFTATGLPNGLHISSSGEITGRATKKGSFTVHVTGTEAVTTVHSSATFIWKITS
jgi:hypothetical protein